MVGVDATATSAGDLFVAESSRMLLRRLRTTFPIQGIVFDAICVKPLVFTYAILGQGNLQNIIPRRGSSAQRSIPFDSKCAKWEERERS